MQYIKYEVKKYILLNSWKACLLKRVLSVYLLIEPIWRLHPHSRKQDKAIKDMTAFAKQVALLKLNMHVEILNGHKQIVLIIFTSREYASTRKGSIRCCIVLQRIPKQKFFEACWMSWWRKGLKKTKLWMK